MVRYALVVALFIVIVCGAYYSGYSIGASNTRVEYVTQEKEVIKYVAKETAIIHSKPNANRSVILERMRNNQL